MRYCSHCGAAVEDDARFCDQCGSPLNVGGTAQQAAVQAAPEPAPEPVPELVWKPETSQDSSGSYSASGSYSSNGSNSGSYGTSSASSASTDDRRLNILCYVGPFFLLPMFLKKTDLFSRYHINQGMVLFCLEMLCKFIFDGGLLGVIAFLFELYCVVLGAKNVAAGKMEPLPLIGKIQLLKK